MISRLLQYPTILFKGHNLTLVRAVPGNGIVLYGKGYASVMHTHEKTIYQYVHHHWFRDRVVLCGLFCIDHLPQHAANRKGKP